MADITVELVDNMGNDLTTVNAARVSFDKESTWEVESYGEQASEDIQELSEKDKKLINYLATHNHFTPFTHPQITLRETVPIFVARQRFKHMVGFTYNEVSRRYVDDEPTFYVPDSWRSRPNGSVKQGSGGTSITSMERMTGRPSTPEEEYEIAVNIVAGLYERMLRAGVAPEQARMVLPQSMMTSYYVTGSLAAFARMVKQRKDTHAQKEIQDLAQKVDEVIRPLYPVSWSALVDA
jgi:thymidylate synthase (FAD)